MARVVALEKDDRRLRGLQPTEVTARYIVDEWDGRKIIQINTYGSAGREYPDKLSQTLQFDQSAAMELLRILQIEFGDKA